MLDGDEFYTTADILAIRNYISFYGMFDFYELPLKTYIFDGTVWMDGFAPPRIYWAKKHGGLAEFYWDNDIRYQDGTDRTSGSKHVIPKEVAFVRHLTWLHKNGERK